VSTTENPNLPKWNAGDDGSTTTATFPVTVGDPAPSGPIPPYWTPEGGIRALRQQVADMLAELADLRLRSGPPARLAPLPQPPISPCTHPAGHFWANLSDDGRAGVSCCLRCKQWNTPAIITRG